MANDLLAVVNESVQESIESVWLCNKCKSAMERKKISAGSQFNKMKGPEVPSVFIGLNTLEQRLISKATVFMKMANLPRGGQKAVRGQVINFPSMLTVSFQSSLVYPVVKIFFTFSSQTLLEVNQMALSLIQFTIPVDTPM